MRVTGALLVHSASRHSVSTEWSVADSTLEGMNGLVDGRWEI